MKKGYIKTGRVMASKPTQIMTFKELGEEFLKYSEIRGLSTYTIASYRYQIGYILEFGGRGLKCADIGSDFMQRYVQYLKEEKRISNPVTINSYLQNTSPILKYGIQKRYILVQVAIPYVKGQECIKEIYNEEELHTLLAQPKKRDFVSVRTHAIIWMLASTGIRARELRELRIKNIDLLNRILKVNQTKNKKPRIIPVSTSLYQVLENYAMIRGGDAEDYLFPSIYNEILAMTSLQDSVKKYCIARGVEKHGLHMFRHTFITNAVNQNVNPLILQRITGHSTMTQLNRYYNARTFDLIDVIDGIAPKDKTRKATFKK